MFAYLFVGVLKKKYFFFLEVVCSFCGWLSYLLGMALNAVLLKPKQMLIM
uniref:Uncharacterized protein n=1 Tax=Anguilla anguilla TaxID=7936 RepID=A0A0E9UNN4_ANGAN